MTQFSPGDRVTHARRPEWGEGVVQQATTITHQGQQAQRVVVTFRHHGRVALNTALAALLSKDEATGMTRNNDGSGGGWLATLERQVGGNGDELSALPEAMSDPFSSDASRLRATLDSFRFTAADPRSLIDWAIAQTGLDDPMTRYTRHELEQGLQRFNVNRDRHLKELVTTLKRGGQQPVIDRAMSQTPFPTARQALKRALRA